MQLSIDDLKQACDGFHPSKQIGKGGFGEVYRGYFRSTSIAVKLLTDVCILGNLLTSLHDTHYLYYLFPERVFSVARGVFASTDVSERTSSCRAFIAEVKK